MKKMILIMISILVWGSHVANAQSKVFFEKIYCGDKLEKCIANGLVQNTGGASAWNNHDWELTDLNIKSYFPRTGVIFDGNNIIKEIELLASDYLHENSASDVDTKKSFNYMLRYFSQRYTGMKQRKINTRGQSSCTYDLGTEYIWETSYLIIKVKHYNCLHDNENCKNSKNGHCFNESFNTGSFTKVNIFKK